MSPPFIESQSKENESRACGQCARAKTRCLFDVGSRQCQRCTRLKKECNPQPQAVRRPRLTPARTTRVSQLERKVDHLVNVITSGRDSSAPEPTYSPTHTSLYNSAQSGRLNEHVTSSSSGGIHAVWPSVPPDDDAEAESLVETFHDELAVHFPFVVVPAGSVSELRKRRPFLCKAISMAACFRNRERQKQLGGEITKELSKRLLSDGEQNLDLLQGLLIHIAWYHGHLTTHSQMSNLMQLAIALLADLRLNKPAHANDRRRLIFDNSHPTYGFSADSKSMTSEERRAVAGCFYLSSIVSTAFRKLDAIPYSNHIQEACQALLNANEYDSDVYLVHLVKLQSLTERVGQALPYDEPYRPWQAKAPISMQTEVLAREFELFHQSLASRFRQDGFLILHQHNAGIYVYEISLYDAPWGSSHIESQSQSSHRLDALYSCLKATQSYMRTFLDIPNSLLFTLPYALWAQLAYALLICSRLSLIEVRGWNLNDVRRELDFAGILMKILGKIDDAGRFARERWLSAGTDRILDRVSSKMERIKVWFDDQVHGPLLPGNQQTTSAPEYGRHSAGESGLDDSFWQELMSDFEPLPIPD